MYTQREFSIICHDLISFEKKISRINEFGELTGYSFVPVHYTSIGELWWVNENSLYIHNNIMHTLTPIHSST